MLQFLLAWLVLSAAVWVTAVLLPGFTVKSVGGAIWIAALYGLLDWALGWLLFNVIALGTLGIGYLLDFLTRWLVKALLLKLTDLLSTTLTIRSFGTAVLGALIMTIVQTIGVAGLRWLF
jgi:putative membrane protein